MKTIAFPLLAILLLSSAPAVAFGACHAVGPAATGNGSGSDWNNQMNKLPATLVRGDTYYLADSAAYGYGSYTVNTSGSTLVTVKKAKAADYGQNCSPSIAAGWNAATMGSGQASFTGMHFTSGAAGSNITFDGAGTYAAQGCGGGPSGTTPSARPVTPSDCGIVVDDNACTSTAANACDFPVSFSTAYGSATTGVTFRYVEWFGNFHNRAETSFSWAFGPNVANSYTIQHMYAHNTGCTYLHQDGGSRTVSYSYFWALLSDSSAGGCHGEATYDTGSPNGIYEHDNVYRDIAGSAVHWYDSTNATNLLYYNNIYWVSSPVPNWVGVAWGMLACANNSTCSNVAFNHNTMVNITGSYQAGINLVGGGGTCTNCVARNNLWYQVDPALGLSLSGVTEDHNSFINSNGNYGGGTGDINIASGDPNPFVNWQGGNFHLATENAHWTGGATLSSPYNVDPSGVTRGADGTWERGAYEFVQGGGGAVPPTGLSAAAQ